MERQINRVKLYVNDNDKSREVATSLEDNLRKYHFDIVDENPELVISVGGDGSFLRMVKEMRFNPDIYYIGVNSGTLGFLQEIDIKDCADFVERLNSNKYKIEDISIEETKIKTNNHVYKYISLNEIVVRSRYFNTLRIPVYVDDEYLETFTGDGLLLSTSTGSTAYNMSFGGSIIYNTLDTLSITPIAPLNNKAYKTLTNSLIIPGDKVITLLPMEGHNNLYFMIDGVNKVFDNVEKVETRLNPKGIKCLHMKDFHFIKVINDKILEQ
jgi:NAD+ kinase